MGRDTSPARDQGAAHAAGAPTVQQQEPHAAGQGDAAAESQPLLQRAPAPAHPLLTFVRNMRAAAAGVRARAAPGAVAAPQQTVVAGAAGEQPQDAEEHVALCTGKAHKGSAVAAGERECVARHEHDGDASCSSSGSASSSASSTPRKAAEPTICRICLEEDTLAHLEQPCGCAGTQRYVHHACLQKWVNEKGHTKCEICEQQYKGEYSVPPRLPDPSVSPLAPIGSLYLTVRDQEGLGRDSYLMDHEDWDDARHPTASWCFSFLLLVLIITVLRHMVPHNDTSPGASHSSSMLPSGATATSTATAFSSSSGMAHAAYDSSSGGGSGGMSIRTSSSYSYDFLAGLSLFLLWMLTKAFLVALPLYTVMRIAVRQSQQEAFDEMYRVAQPEGAGPAPAPLAATGRGGVAAPAEQGRGGRVRQVWLAMQPQAGASGSGVRTGISGSDSSAIATAGQAAPRRLVGVV